MCINAGKLDRVLRVIIGLALMIYGFTTSNILLTAIGSIPLLTGAIGFCPFYPIIKLDTGCKK